MMITIVDLIPSIYSFAYEEQDEEASDCPLLTPSPPPAVQINNSLESAPIYRPLEGAPLEMITTPTLENINEEDGLNAFMNVVNSSSKPLHDGR